MDGINLTPAELLSFGIHAVGSGQSSIGKRDHPNQPVDLRCGNDRYVRSESGCVTIYFDWYDPAQKAARERSAKEFSRQLYQAILDTSFISAFLIKAE